MLLFSYLVLSGVTTGALYALVALGIVVVNKATGIVNFAQGELFMVSGFIAWTLHVRLAVPYALTMVLAVAAGYALGWLTDRVAFRPLRGTDVVNLVLATIGIGFILRGVARVVWGGQGDYLSFPPVTAPDPITLAGIMIIPQQIAALAGALAIMLAFAAYFRLTRTGRMMRATADNAKAATLVGIRTDRIRAQAFGIGAAVAAAAAVLAAPLTLLYPDMGFPFFIKGFASAVLGGLTSLPGAVVGGLTVGVAEALAGGYIDSSVTEVSGFVVIMLALITMPSGLLGGGRARSV